MTTEDGYEQQFALNHLAGFRLTYELLPYLLKEGGRVIMTSSESHKNMKVRWSDVMMRKHYNPLLAYKQSKLCNMLFAQGLNDRYGAKGLHAYGVDPGLVNTDIGNKTSGIVDFVWKIRKRFGVRPTVPAQDYLYLCEQCEPPAGLYFHHCKSIKYNKQVTTENAKRLFELSEQLCGGICFVSISK
jgi:NAD(P)-dependent dehydrogenase (short-subunit alcohol dehydrogenase family)